MMLGLELRASCTPDRPLALDTHAVPLGVLPTPSPLSYQLLLVCFCNMDSAPLPFQSTLNPPDNFIYKEASYFLTFSY